MKPLLFASACGLMLAGLAACAPTTPPTARVALDCPREQGDLTLSSMSPDKKTCVYASHSGDEVSLRLLPVSTGNYEAALTPVEQELQAEVGTAADAQATAAGDKGATAVATAGSAAATSAAEAAKQAAEDAKGAVQAGKAKDKTDSDDDNDTDARSGDHAHIDLPGIHISADDDKADVNVGGINVNAGENGATVRMSRDVRLRGEAFSAERRGFRSTYILARDDLKNGWKAVGYEAGGPKAGPITVAVFKAREGHRHDVSEDVKRLVRRNGGV